MEYSDPYLNSSLEQPKLGESVDKHETINFK